MPTDNEVVATLQSRVVALEKRQRWITCAGIASVLACGVVLAASSSLAQDAPHARARPTVLPTAREAARARVQRAIDRRGSRPSDEVKAATIDDSFFGESYNVVFAGNDIEGMLSTDVETGPGLTFFDESGEPRMLLGFDPIRNEAYLEMYNRRGRVKFARYAR